MTITIDEAIKILEQNICYWSLEHLGNVEEAEKLGIEALKRVKEARKKAYFTTRSLMPGETKE
jgi:hypothetical protein